MRRGNHVAVDLADYQGCLYHNVTAKVLWLALCLICGTSLEQIKPESLTRPLSEFVHGYISVEKDGGTLELVTSSWEAASGSIKLVNFISQVTSAWSIPGIVVRE
jgi:hypothetical protein